MGAGTRSGVRGLSAEPEPVNPIQSRNAGSGNLPGQPGRSWPCSPLSATSRSPQHRGIFEEIGVGREARREGYQWISVLLPSEMSWDLNRSTALTQGQPHLLLLGQNVPSSPKIPSFAAFFLTSSSPTAFPWSVAAPGSGCSMPTSLPPLCSLSPSWRDLLAPAPP